MFTISVAHLTMFIDKYLLVQATHSQSMYFFQYHSAKYYSECNFSTSATSVDMKLQIISSLFLLQQKISLNGMVPVWLP